VAPEVIQAPPEAECSGNALIAQQQAAINAADACTAAMKKPGARIIFTGQLDGAFCDGVAGYTSQNSNTVVVDDDALGASPRAVSHELGHMLNLPDLFGTLTDRLMFNVDNGMLGTTLVTGECDTARSAASAKQTLWNVQ